MTAEVIVVGGGPAGATTALLLARAGRDVLLLDRQEFPRPKPCGECVSAGATPLLRRLGVLDAVLRHAPARLRGWRIRTAAGTVLESAFEPHDEPALAIERARLDAALLDAARAAGARVETGTRVTNLVRGTDGAVAGVQTDRGPRRAALVVGADGLRSVVARRAELLARAPRLRRASFTVHARGMDTAGWGELWVGRGQTLGIAPVEDAGADALYNVTLVVSGAAARLDARAVLARAGAASRAAYSAPSPASEDVLASGPFDWPTRAVVLPGLALVGDAAGYFDPFTGQGIMHALHGAELLAREAPVALDRDRHPLLRGYARRVRARMAEAHALQHVVDAVISRPRLAERTLAALAASPRAARALLRAIAGSARPRSLLSPAVLASFLVPSTGRNPPA